MNRLFTPCTCRTALAAARPSPRPSLTFAPTLLASSRRAIHAPAAVERRIPQPRGPYTDPSALLSVSKRCLESYADKFEDWPALFSKTSAELRDAGMTVKESRYLLWLLERYRQGHDPAKIAIPPTPKKTIRGHGPRVQNGIRIR